MSAGCVCATVRQQLLQVQSPCLAIAVSGGADSMSLLDAVVRVASGRECNMSCTSRSIAASEQPFVKRVIALTVDHALRPDSRDDVNLVLQFCQHLGVPAHATTMDWNGSTRHIMPRARQRRYESFHALAHALGSKEIWTAHHAGAPPCFHVIVRALQANQ